MPLIVVLTQLGPGRRTHRGSLTLRSRRRVRDLPASETRCSPERFTDPLPMGDQGSAAIRRTTGRGSSVSDARKKCGATLRLRASISVVATTLRGLLSDRRTHEHAGKATPRNSFYWAWALGSATRDLFSAKWPLSKGRNVCGADGS